MRREQESGARKTTARVKRQRHGLSAEDRHRLIAEAAYRHAERRGFMTADDPVVDWLDAEQEGDDPPPSTR
jgi:hypothetical protein